MNAQTKEGITKNHMFSCEKKHFKRHRALTPFRSELLEGYELVSIQGVIRRKVAMDVPQMELKIVGKTPRDGTFNGESHGQPWHFERVYLIDLHQNPPSHQWKQFISPYAPCLWPLESGEIG